MAGAVTDFQEAVPEDKGKIKNRAPRHGTKINLRHAMMEE
jgi:hypothetical protein